MKRFDGRIWEKLMEVKLNQSICNMSTLALDFQSNNKLFLQTIFIGKYFNVWDRQLLFQVISKALHLFYVFIFCGIR